VVEEGVQSPEASEVVEAVRRCLASVAVVVLRCSASVEAVGSIVPA
jgi:hypothetical protein